jgi:NTE family protein
MRGSDVLEPNNLRLFFAATSAIGDFARETGQDARLLARVARALAPLPQAQPPRAPVFAPREPLRVRALEGKRIGLVASGGSGATAALCGIRRALEEASLDVVALSACSGSVLFATLWAAGLSSDQMARFWLDLAARDYVDPDWRALARAPFSRFRGYGGLLRGTAIEQRYRDRFGDLALGETKIPLSAVVWNIDLNRVEYIGSRATPELGLAQAARVAISIPVFVEPVRLGAHMYGDGGVVDIFPTPPLLAEEPLDVIFGVNCYMPPDFAGEDVTGWNEQTWSILRASGQLRYAAYLELAREHARALGERLILLHPVPYAEVRGARFYDTFLDRRRWPEFMRLGHQAARAALQRIADAGTSRAASGRPLPLTQ